MSELLQAREFGLMRLQKRPKEAGQLEQRPREYARVIL